MGAFSRNCTGAYFSTAAPLFFSAPLTLPPPPLRSTNRHALDASRQIATRFNENLLTDTILPRLLGQRAQAFAGGAGAGAAYAPPPPPTALVPPNTASLHGDLASAPISATVFSSVWASSISASVPLPTASPASSTIKWACQAKLTRACVWKKVCDATVNKSSVVLQYMPRDEHVHGVRTAHDHTLQPVATALMLKPAAFFSASPKSVPEGTPRSFCLAQAFAPLTAETPRSLEYTLHKPRTLDPRWVIVPVSELSHPLRSYNYFENAPPRPWASDKKDVPVRESRPTPNTVLVSTVLRW